jgi:DNA-binding NarL/FixJ family response regulator
VRSWRDGTPYAAHIAYLINSGLRVSDIHADAAIETASSGQPDTIVLDFAVDGDLMERLKAHELIRHIPVIALVDLIGDRASAMVRRVMRFVDRCDSRRPMGRNVSLSDLAGQRWP